MIRIAAICSGSAAGRRSDQGDLARWPGSARRFGLSRSLLTRWHREYRSGLLSSFGGGTNLQRLRTRGRSIISRLRWGIRGHC
jgi:hypothetical protein